MARPRGKYGCGLTSLGFIYLVERILELGGFSPLHFFLTDLLSCYIVRLISIFKMCSWGWGLFSEFGITHKHQASLGEAGLFLSCSFFTDSSSTCHHLDFQFRVVLVCLKLGHVNSRWALQAFQICVVRGEGAVTADWHGDGWGSQAEAEALIPMKPPSVLSAGLSPMKPNFKVILVHGC